MKKRTKGSRFLLGAALLFALSGSFNMIGCSSDSDDDGGSGTSQPSSAETETKLVIGTVSITQTNNEDSTVTLTAAADTSTTTAKNIAYAFALKAAVEGVTITDNGNGTATLANTAAEEKTVSVVVTATAENADEKTAEASVTLAAKGVTYNYTITLADLQAVAGKSATVTANATVAANEGVDAENLPSVTYEFTLADGTAETVKIAVDGATATLTNEGDTTQSVTVNVKASAEGAASKSSTTTVKVAPQAETLTLGEVTLSTTSGSVEQGGSVTVTASGAVVTSSDSARDAEVSGELPSVTYAWSTDYSGISFDDSTASEVTITAASTASTGDATITVTASAEGATSASATYELTVVKAYPYTVYSQDFEDVTDVSNVAASPNYAAGLSITDGALKYALLDSSVNTRNAYTTENFNIPLSGQYKIDFDAALTAGTNQNSELAIRTTKATTNGSDGCNAPSSANYLFKMVAPAGSTTWTLNDAASTTVVLTAGTAYHYTILVDLDASKVYATIGGTAISNLEVTPAADITTYRADNINLLCGRYSAVHTLDNVVIKSTVDPVVISDTSLTAELATAVAGDADNTITAAGGTINLSAVATAKSVVAQEEKNVSFAYAVTAGSDYASVSDTGVLTLAANDTLTNHAVTVTMTASADGAAPTTATYSVTVLADESKLSDVTITGDDSVTMGSDITLTANVTSTSSANETIAYTWTSSATNATVTGNDGTATVTGVSITDAVTITVTVKAGNVTKTAEKVISVAASTATLSTLTLSAETLSVANTKTGTFTVTPNDGLVPTYTVESSNTEACTVTGEAADTGVYTVTITPVANGNSTITVTATLDSVTVTATCAVTIQDPTKVTLYSQDFESGETDWTPITSGYDKCAQDDISSNANTSDYIYAIGCRSGDTGTQVAASSSTDGTIVEFDLKFDGVYAGKSSSFALLGAKNTANWLSSDKEILTFSAGSTTAGYINTFTINGTDYLEACAVSTDGSESSAITGNTLKRGSTGWLHVKATLDFTNHTMDLVVTKIATDATVCNVTALAFMDGDAASSLEYIYAAAGKNYGGVYMDNIEVYDYE